jgi:LEA14-like dessication related protein
MNDEQLELIIKAFKLNENDFSLETPSFSITSDHNLFRICFTVNGKFLIYKTKGRREKIQVDKRLDVEKFMNEIKEIIENKSQQNMQ